MLSKKTYALDVNQNARYAESIADAVKNGDVRFLEVFSDEWIQEYASAEDYEFWMTKKQINQVGRDVST